MKQKIYTPYDSEYNVCHSELVSDTSDSELAKQSHFQISKLVNFQILFLFFLCSFFSYGQEYQWQWAKSGGGEMGNTAFTFSKSDEHVLDIAVDGNNNYYYLMSIFGNSPMYNDNELPENITLEHYGNKDILLLSTDENGNYRWHQVIGGFGIDNAYRIVLDNNDGVYLNAVLTNNAIEGDNNSYTHLSSEVTLPKVPENWDYTIPHPAFRVGYLLKYSQVDGSLLAYKNYQEEVLFQGITLGRLWIDSNNTLHTIVGFLEGVHLEGAITVEEGGYEVFLIELDSSLNIVEIRDLPLLGYSPDRMFFTFDESIAQYYIGGITNSNIHSYNGVEIEEKLFILAINGETLEEEWRNGFNITQNSVDELYSMYIDNTHNIYLSGMYPYNISNPTLQERYFGDYELPVNVGGESSARVPYTIKLNSAGVVQWVSVPDSYTNNSAWARNTNYDVTVVNNEVVTVPNSRSAVWGTYEVGSEYSSVPAVVRLNPETGDVLGATYIDNFGAFTKVVGDQNGDLVLGGYFFGQMFSDNEGLPTLQSANNYTDFFMTKLVLDTDSSTDNFLQANIKVYPNPTTDIVYFETEEQLQTYELYNMLGQRVKQGTLANSPQIDLSSFTSGTYFIKVITKAGDTGIFKVVKK